MKLLHATLYSRAFVRVLQYFLLTLVGDSVAVLLCRCVVVSLMSVDTVWVTHLWLLWRTCDQHTCGAHLMFPMVDVPIYSYSQFYFLEWENRECGVGDNSSHSSSSSNPECQRIENLFLQFPLVWTISKHLRCCTEPYSLNNFSSIFISILSTARSYGNITSDHMQTTYSHASHMVGMRISSTTHHSSIIIFFSVLFSWFLLLLSLLLLMSGGEQIERKKEK